MTLAKALKRKAEQLNSVKDLNKICAVWLFCLPLQSFPAVESDSTKKKENIEKFTIQDEVVQESLYNELCQFQVNKTDRAKS